MIVLLLIPVYSTHSRQAPRTLASAYDLRDSSLAMRRVPQTANNGLPIGNFTCPSVEIHNTAPIPVATDSFTACGTEKRLYYSNFVQQQQTQVSTSSAAHVTTAFAYFMGTSFSYFQPQNVPRWRCLSTLHHLHRNAARTNFSIVPTNSFCPSNFHTFNIIMRRTKNVDAHGTQFPQLRLTSRATRF